MMSFATGLKDQVVQAIVGKPWKENPLRTIGLSPLLLNLGLSADELYTFVRKTSRALFATMHEDRRGKSEDQIRLSRAFETLKDRELFDKALDEFRTLRAETTHETEVFRVLSQNRAAEIDSLRAELQKAQAEASSQMATRQAFTDYLRMQGIHVSAKRLEHPSSDSLSPWEGMNPLDCKLLTYASVWTEVARSVGRPEELDRVKLDYQTIANSRGPADPLLFKSMRRRAERSGMLATNPEIFTRIEKGVLLPVIHWNIDRALEAHNLGPLAENSERAPEHVFLEEMTPAYRQILDLEYRQALKTIKSFFPGPQRFDGVAVSVRQAALKQSSIRTTKRGMKIRVLGCLAAPDIKVSSLPLRLSAVQMNLLVSEFRPFLFRRGILVGVEEKHVRFHSHEKSVREGALQSTLRGLKTNSNPDPFVVMGVVLDFK